MTTSNLTVAGTATLPSATSATLGGVLVDSTASGLLVMTDGHIAVKASTGLIIDGTGHLKVDPSLNTLTNYVPLNGNSTITGNLSLLDPVSGNNIAFSVGPSGAAIQFNVGNPAGIGDLIFTDGSTQTTAFNSDVLLNIKDWVSNAQTLVWSGTPTSITLGPDNNCEVIQLSSYPSTLNVTFPTPANDGQFFELVIVGGSGGYSFSGVGIDGVTAVTILDDIGSSAYEKGGFRYKTSTNSWYQVS